MQKILKKFSTLNDELRQLFLSRYPGGIEPKDLISFTDPKGKKVRAVELPTPTALYLITLDDAGKSLGKGGSDDLEDLGLNFMDEDDDEDDSSPEPDADNLDEGYDDF